jgi:hypothetical protein
MKRFIISTMNRRRQFLLSIIVFIIVFKLIFVMLDEDDQWFWRCSVPRYALVTLVKSKQDVLSAIVLCDSIREFAGMEFSFATHQIDIVAFVRKDQQPNIDFDHLHCCFTKVIVLESLLSTETEQSLDEIQFWKFSRYERLIYLHVNTIVMKFNELNALLHMPLKYASVPEMTVQGEIHPFLKTEQFFMLEPKFSTYHNMVQTFMNSNHQSNLQEFLQKYFENMEYILPVTFNIKFGLKNDLWEQYYPKAVSVRYTVDSSNGAASWETAERWRKQRAVSEAEKCVRKT